MLASNHHLISKAFEGKDVVFAPSVTSQTPLLANWKDTGVASLRRISYFFDRRQSPLVTFYWAAKYCLANNWDSSLHHIISKCFSLWKNCPSLKQKNCKSVFIYSLRSTKGVWGQVIIIAWSCWVCIYAPRALHHSYIVKRHWYLHTFVLGQGCRHTLSNFWWNFSCIVCLFFVWCVF